MTKVRIPLAKPSFDEREVEAVRRVLASGWVVQGAEVEAFEAALCRLHKTNHCIAVSSGTAALHICYLALDIGPGDAVFVPSFAWPSAANMAIAVGARPVFVDVFADTYNIDPADLRVRIKQCVRQKWGIPRAVVPVHEFGLPVEMDSILAIAEESGLEVIEDAACALGATYKDRPVGTFGKMGILSFHPRKAATTGEGGAILTNDDELAGKCRIWRNHGQVFRNGKREFHVPGFNYRMTEIQAVIGQVQLKKIPAILKRRREIASQYLSQLTDCPEIILPADSSEHTWQTFMVMLDPQVDLGEVINKMTEQGIGIGQGSVAGHCQQVYRELCEYKEDELPVSRILASHGLALPLYADMRLRDVTHCAEMLRSISDVMQR